MNITNWFGKILISIFIAFSLTSCNNEDESTQNEDLIVGRWDVLEDNGNVYHWRVFYAGGTGDSYINGSNDEWFEWSIKGEILHLIYYNVGKDSKGTAYECKIITLNDKTLIYTYESPYTEGLIITKTHKRHL